jgi:tRNA nucleotidyltransferase/poly(A) polymerase
LKAVGNPNERFAEDPLRILRVLQFANRFGFTIEAKTMEAIKKNVALLDNITGERILEEFKKAFTKGNSKGNMKFVEMLIDTGIGTHIFGTSFDPIGVNIIYGDKWIVNMILLFINGGDFARMKPSTDVSTAITLARALLKNDPLSVMFKNERYLQVITDALKSIGDPELMDKLGKLNGVPLANKDLKISSEYLMSKGYSGPKLGAIQRQLVDEVYMRKISNDENDIKHYLEMIKVY